MGGASPPTSNGDLSRLHAGWWAQVEELAIGGKHADIDGVWGGDGAWRRESAMRVFEEFKMESSLDLELGVMV